MSTTKPKKVVSIHGAPRSGTTWLARMVALIPKSAFRYQPFFSYAFKDRISPSCSPDELSVLLDEIFNSQDQFVLQTGKEKLGAELSSRPERSPDFMVMKSVRFHELITPLLEADKRVVVLAIVRHPCAVINSWLMTERENPQGKNARLEWDLAVSKNQNSISEYWGFKKWLELTYQFLHLESEYPDRFMLIQYEELVQSLEQGLTSIFTWLGYELNQEILDIAASSQVGNDENHDYSVVKNPRVATRWQDELDHGISDEITKRLQLHPQITNRFQW